MKETYVRKPWVNTARAVKKVQNDRKNIYQVISLPEKNPSVEKIETRVNKIDSVKVIQKDEAHDVDTVTIHTKKKEDLKRAEAEPDVVAVIPLPEKKKMGFSGEIRDQQAFFFAPGEVCPASQVPRNAAKIDVAGAENVVPSGEGTLIIVWDFIPTSGSFLDAPEFTDRPGGSITFYPNNSDAFDEHGAQCCSVASGKLAGIAPGAQLALLGLGNNTVSDLEVIRQVALAFEGPVLVNMSFALEWRDVDDQSLKQSIFDYMDILNQVMYDIIEENPRIMFFVAAGNETQNMCETTEPLTFSTGNKYYNKIIAWPQFARGRSTPFYQVGATSVRQTPPKRQVAVYSNFGPCVSYFSQGGAICAYGIYNDQYRAIQGTSFSTPFVAAMAAVLFSQNLNQTADQVDSRMRSELGSDTATGAPTLDTTELFLALPLSLDPSVPDVSSPPKKELPVIEDIMKDPDMDLSAGSPVFDKEKEVPQSLFVILAVCLVGLLLISVYELIRKPPKKK